MSVAITEEHRTLASTAADFLQKQDARGAARRLLEAPAEELPPFWAELRELGWLGLHLPEEYGGSGYGIPELVVVVEELGRAVAPGPFVPTVIASAVLAAAAPEELRARLLPGLADGSVLGAVALHGNVEVRDGKATGPAGIVLGGGLLAGETAGDAPAHVLLAAVGDDVAVVDIGATGTKEGVTVELPPNLDPTRRSTRIWLNDAPATLLPGARPVLVDLARTILAAEATGVARECTRTASEYAKIREQFGRPIGTFQAVKHHCANMLVAAELATAAVWDAARATTAGPDQRAYTAAMAATLAPAAAEQNAQLNIQVHGGIGFTWEHDAHLYVRRASAIAALLGRDATAVDVTNLARAGTRRERSVDLPPEAEQIRETVRAFVEQVRGLDPDAQRNALVDAGYAVPHWPRPWGRDAGAVEQLVIEQEFAAAGIRRPQYGITGWVILTLIQHATPEQISRWVPPALRQEVIWCQLFSEPNAGSDAAGIRTRGTRVEGGWLVNGQKVWTSGAHLSRFGLATVRTNPDAPKHRGITMMVIDMKAKGVEVRPLRMASGGAEFNEVFFQDVFVPDSDVVGPVDGGWTVARATLGNESVSIGGGDGAVSFPVGQIISAFDANPGRLGGGAGRVGRYIATSEAMRAMNLRTAHRAVSGGGPGPEGAVAKLVITELGHEAAAILSELIGTDAVLLDGPGENALWTVLLHRAMAIAGGTSEIKRNQIAERILGLPRDPLLR